VIGSILADLLAADTTLIIALVTALATPVFGFLGVWYGTRRKSQTEERTAREAANANRRASDAQQTAANAEAWASQTRAASDVLVRTVESMRIDMDRQDADHERQITALRAEVDRISARFEECERVRREQSVELIAFRGRRRM
jgi:hypothetical protein